MHEASAFGVDVSKNDVDFSGMEGHIQDLEDDEDAATASTEIITADDEHGTIELCEGMCAASSGAKSSKACAQRCEAAMFDCIEKSRAVSSSLLRFQLCEHVVIRGAQISGSDSKGPIADADCDDICVSAGNKTCASGCKDGLHKCAPGSSSESCRHVVLSKYVSPSGPHKPDFAMKAELNFVHRLPRPVLSPMSSAMSKLNAMDTASELGSLGKLCDSVCADAKSGKTQCLASCKTGMANCMEHADERTVQGAEEHGKCTQDVVRAHVA